MSEPALSRRSVLLGAVGVGGAAMTAGAWWAFRPEEAAGAGRVSASSEEVRRVEQVRRGRGTGRTVRASLTAEPVEVDLGGRTVRTWAYDGRVPGPVLRCRAGDQLEVEVANRLPEPTTVHWHGLRIRNDMDGVPNLTQAPIAAGESMRYSFVAPDPGTYWFHPHVGVQRERGLYCPLVVDDPRDAGDYDVEFLVVLDDWIDGAVATPDQVLAALRTGGMDARFRTPVQAGRIVDRSSMWQYHVPAALANPPAGIPPVPPATRLASSVEFPFYLLNGRLPTAPETFRARPGQRARIRLVNAAGATVFRVALGGHRLTVTHTDGFPVEPVTVDTLQLGSGERYDVLVTLDDGTFPLVAVAEGKGAQALGAVRTAAGPVPRPTAAPRELAGRLLALADLQATPEVRMDDRSPDVHHTLYLTGDMSTFEWRINAETYNHHRPFDGITPMPVRAGQHVRLEMINQTPMYHPMHLHGHTFAIRTIGDASGAGDTDMPTGTRKDTAMVAPGERLLVDFTADNPGQWLVHCHNAYHMATGMASMLSYLPTRRSG
ncbi:Multicopper oxidase with three cupredoxin domains (includes cell division protein FtsP and spore coat protein CotA) [Amycolatopsis arida]|uniref:Multicopper oxidase with three cupredoxin domains (Includes cell division protein FtsP and spore coat protein CotA) n=1 Tax=Amycolatopsis arida TaxID=587909 RepID=A0A1I5M7K5_9PSEU|nr:multicopper oxidase family protein [Amycolatopsis arida]TDX94001.1 FtsP/CotA-like multicopper oxidase with cupredoxin domain [Amycolatopsis arida]SFP05582.1 Multicopper oxidase with three cupredoxin domains (includes cell division protein FtsP and spore coat protein CotA) [Amycolatopsis arida]